MQVVEELRKLHAELKRELSQLLRTQYEMKHYRASSAMSWDWPPQAPAESPSILRDSVRRRMAAAIAAGRFAAEKCLPRKEPKTKAASLKPRKAVRA